MIDESKATGREEGIEPAQQDRQAGPGVEGEPEPPGVRVTSVIRLIEYEHSPRVEVATAGEVIEYTVPKEKPGDQSGKG
jgi:hypothetical protein